MAEHECTHLVVVSPDEGEPVGVISSRARRSRSRAARALALLEEVGLADRAAQAAVLFGAAPAGFFARGLVIVAGTRASTPPPGVRAAPAGRAIERAT